MVGALARLLTMSPVASLPSSLVLVGVDRHLELSMATSADTMGITASHTPIYSPTPGGE